MERNTANYMVVVERQRLPESFTGPNFVRNILSRLSRKDTRFIGGKLYKTSLEEAQEIAQENTTPRYTDMIDLPTPSHFNLACFGYNSFGNVSGNFFIV